MRPGTGCQSCRARHLKCLVPDGQLICTRCAEAGRKCEFLPRYRFRQVAHVDTASQGLRSRTELRYQDDQPWVETRGEVSFVLEDGLGFEYGGDEAETMDDPGHGAERFSDDAATLDKVGMGADDGEDDGVGDDDHPVAGLPAFEASPGTSYHNHSPATRSYLTPASVPELTRRYVFGVTGSTATPYTPLGTASGSNAASPAISLPTPGSMPTRLKLSRREAFLVHHYTNKIAPWVRRCSSHVIKYR